MPEVADPSSSFHAGQIVANRYRIVELCGRGAMGQVYRAEDLRLQQSVALKFLPPEVEGRPDVLERFLVEARLARQVSHPNVCRMYDVDEAEGRCFLSMEWVDGENLVSLLYKVGRLASAKVAAIGLEIALGLDAIHSQGIIHRDLKPSNLMLDGLGRVRITDFGIAGIAEDIDPLEISIGTPAYMAPEQIRGAEVTPRSDLFSLGLVLWELAVGRPTFAGETSTEVFARRRREIEPPSRLCDDLDPALEGVILRCLELEPERRPLTAQEVAAALDGGANVSKGTLARAVLVVRREGFENPDQESFIAGARHARTVAKLLERHGGELARGGLAGGRAVMIFDLPRNALQHALGEHAGLAHTAGESDAEPQACSGIAFGEIHVEPRGTETTISGAPLAITGLPLEVADGLSSLALPGQTLLSRGAFDLARQRAGEKPEGSADELRWLAHGKYGLPALAEPVEVFEVGHERFAPLTPPPTSEAGTSLHTSDAILGWRPATGLTVPHRPRWRLERRLGEGGFGEVWLAWHVGTGHVRVFKFCYEATRLQALQREITLFRLLKEELGERSDIARILDWNFDEAPYFLEIEHTAGGNLVEWAEEEGGLEAIPLYNRLEIVVQVATALQAAHSVGVLHKDVKPANVLMRPAAGGTLTDTNSSPRAQLTDFGLGAVIEQRRLLDAGITALGFTSGTSEQAGSSYGGTRIYMAPEVLEGRPATLQADIYALGVMLYQMVVGDFGRALAPGWERDVEDDLLRADVAVAVDRDPSHRLASAGQLVERLRSLPERREQIEEECRLRIEREEAQLALARGRQRRRWALGTISVLLLLLLAMLFYSRQIQEKNAQLIETGKTQHNLLMANIANRWTDLDPTFAGLITLEVDVPHVLPFAEANMREIFQYPITHDIYRGEGRFESVAVDPEGRWVVAAAREGFVQFWEAEAPEVTRILPHAAAVTSVRFSPSGEQILTACEDGIARIWTLDSLNPWMALDRGPSLSLPHEDPVKIAIFNPEGNRILTAAGQVVWIWDAPSGKLLQTWESSQPVLQAAYDAQGRRVAITSADRTVRLWDPEMSVTMDVDTTRNRGLGAVAFSPTGDRLAMADDHEIKVWQLLGLKVLGEPQILEGHTDWVLSLVYNREGTRLLSTARDGDARLWQEPRGHAPGEPSVYVFRGHRDRVSKATFSSSEDWIFTSSWDGTVRRWHPRSPGEPAVLWHGGEVKTLRLDEQGKRFLTVAGGPTLKIWALDDPENNSEEIELPFDVIKADFQPNGKKIAVVGKEGRLAILDSEQDEEISVQAAHQDKAWNVLFSPDGTWLATTSLDGTVAAWSSAGELLKRMDLGSTAWPLVFNPISHELITGTEEGRVVAWKPGDEQVKLIGHHEAIIYWVAFHPTSQHLVSVSGDGTAKVWNLDALEKSTTLEIGAPVYDVDFSPDGNQFATSSEDESVRLWDFETGRELEILHHRAAGRVYTVRFDTAGERIVSGTESGEVWVWSLHDLRNPRILKGHAHAVLRVAFHPDGSRVLSAADDGTIRSWQMDFTELVEAMRRATQLCLEPEDTSEPLVNLQSIDQRPFLRCF